VVVEEEEKLFHVILKMEVVVELVVLELIIHLVV
jgi:hypothetical protein